MHAPVWPAHLKGEPWTSDHIRVLQATGGIDPAAGMIWLSRMSVHGTKRSYADLPSRSAPEGPPDHSVQAIDFRTPVPRAPDYGNRRTVVA